MIKQYLTYTVVSLLMQYVLMASLFSTATTQYVDNKRFQSEYKELVAIMEEWQKAQLSSGLDFFVSELQSGFCYLRKHIKKMNPAFSQAEVTNAVNEYLWKQSRFAKFYQDAFKRFVFCYPSKVVTNKILEILPPAPTHDLMLRSARLKQEIFASLTEVMRASLPPEHVNKEWLDKETEKKALTSLKEHLYSGITSKNTLLQWCIKQITSELIDDFKKDFFILPLDSAADQHEKEMRKFLNKEMKTIPNKLENLYTSLDKPTTSKLSDSSKRSNPKNFSSSHIITGLGMSGLVVLLLGAGYYYFFKKLDSSKTKFDSIDDAVAYINRQTTLFTQGKISKIVYLKRKKQILDQCDEAERTQIELRTNMLETIPGNLLIID